jgi:putative radical SAM enzyme (TIGR03279 family)
MLEITAVDPDSIGAELDLVAGDCVLAVNGQVVRDILDFQIYAATEDLLLEVRKRDGELWDLEIEKDAPDLLGLHFEHPEPTQCGNNCIFCFVHQLPRGMRSTLYVKDEDYRFSYLYGSYVTLTNIGEEEIERIVTQKLSPLYVSVHATEEQLRQKLIGRLGPPILDLLKKLTTAGIEIHTQIVLCPGYNDGQELERTVEDLQGLYPGVRSLAVVPVGLTGYRQRLPQLRPPGADEARSVLDTLHGFQDRFLAQTGSRFVHAADELYLTAGTEFPELGNYEDLAQLENGVGMIPLFRAEAAEVLAEAEPLTVPVVSTITGESAYPELARFIGALCAKTGVDIHLYPVRNEFFGGHVSVTGLLTGQDIIAQLRGGLLGEFLLVPDVMLKEGEDVFLDDLSLLDLERELGVHVSKVSSTPWGILEGIEDLAADFRQNPDPDRK